MENASKALIMAGSILIAILVIGLLVYGYGQISNLEQTREDADAVDSIADYMRRFEQFNRGADEDAFYGSEILSLANLQQDYNLSEARENVGYKEINISVKLTKEISGGEKYFKVQTYDLADLLTAYNQLKSDMEPYETPQKRYNNRSVKYYTTKRTEEIAIDFGIPFNSSNLINRTAITRICIACRPRCSEISRRNECL